MYLGPHEENIKLSFSNNLFLPSVWEGLVNLWVPLTEFRRVAIFAKQVPVPDVLVPMLGFSLTYKNVQKWVKKYHQRKFPNIRTFVRKSLVNCKIYTIFAPVNGNKVNVKVNFMYIRSCQPLLQIHCQMPGVINSLTFGDSRTIWQMPTSLLWINSHSSVNEVWVPWNLNQNCLASGKPQR